MKTMKTMKNANYLVFMLLVSMVVLSTNCDGKNNVFLPELEDTAGSTIAGTDTLAAEAIEGILFLREEEKLARDVYLYLYEKFPLRPFANISKSEEAHMKAVKYLIDLYGLEDPVKDNPPGKFENQEIQALYEQLTLKGSQSKEDALRVGAFIEEIDIIDLQEEIILNKDIPELVTVLQNLLQASERHLRAFVGVLRVNGVEYAPVELDIEEFRAIIEQ
jgi:hypothetical protein